jgi:predicted amidophosphoribosyltransferase
MQQLRITGKNRKQGGRKMAKTPNKNTVTNKAAPQAKHCPYCDAEMQALNLPICRACHAEIEYCPHCGLPLDKGTNTCKTCGH